MGDRLSRIIEKLEVLLTELEDIEGHLKSQPQSADNPNPPDEPPGPGGD